MSTFPQAPDEAEQDPALAASRPRSKRETALAWLKEAVIMLAIAGLVLGAVAIFKSPGGGTAVAVAELAPAFEVARTDGSGRLSSDALRGKPVILTFWATWCPTCRDELPELDALHRRAGDAIHVVAVSQEPARVVQGYAQKHHFTLPTYVDRAVFSRYGIESIPTTIVIDADGKIIAELTGAEDADELEAMARGR